jgi:glutamine synthetase
MKEWAVERGATHFTHWFQPMTGSTAEKHDSFASTPTAGRRPPDGVLGQGADQGRAGRVVVPVGRPARHLRGARLHGVGPDLARVHPRDPNGATLCIPTAFCSWTGEALDKKTPLLRSAEALNKAALRCCALLGDAEVEARLSHARLRAGVLPDRPRPSTCCGPTSSRRGRTLFGARRRRARSSRTTTSARSPRVLAFMQEVERELWKLGVPVKTRHNEVAPGQYELAPIFERRRRRRPQHAHDGGAARSRRHGLRLPAAREALRRRQRLGQAQQLVAGDRHAARTCSSRARPRANMRFMVFWRR